MALSVTHLTYTCTIIKPSSNPFINIDQKESLSFIQVKQSKLSEHECKQYTFQMA
uniref:Uncharacterized protein n=1 Tax=Rhizophora mucronata TaxID=61149 RepID=A0A2P2P088_RHIMU